MRLDLVARIKLVMAVASAFLAGTASLGLAQQKKDAPAAAKKETSRAEIVSGVILKVEKTARDGAADPKAGKTKGEGSRNPVLLRLSINTNAVWRDWARDQAQARDNGTAKKDATKGANSVATKGQPVNENSLVVVNVASSTRIETRFRSPTDETSPGATSPEKVKSEEATKSTVKPAGKPVEFRAEDLLPGLYVEAAFQQTGPQDRNTATTITVIRPISVLNSSPPAQPASR